MKKSKKLIAMLLTLLMLLSILPVAAFAEAKTIDGSTVTWDLMKDGTLTIGGTGAMPNYLVDDPPWYNDKSSITTIVIESGVTSIGQYAFMQCSSLASVTIPSSVTSIDNGAFNGCNAVSSLYIDSIESWCKVALGASSSHPLNGSSKSKTLYVNGAEVTELIIPNTVTAIPQYAFYKCTSLASVTIPSSVKSIDKGAFDGCSSLASVTVKATNPPTLSAVLPFPLSNEGFKIYVPYGAGETYKTTDKWSKIADKIFEENPPHEHAAGAPHDAVAATCTTDGNVAYSDCTDANCTYKLVGENWVAAEEIVVSATGHTYGEPSYAWDGDSCTATRTCTVCEAGTDGHSISEAKQGSFSQDTAATCTEAAKGHYEVTFDDAQFGSAQTEANSVSNGEPNGHSFTTYVYNNDASCTKAGTKTAKCDNCDATDTVADLEHPQLDHSYTGEVRANNDGTHSFKCENGCGEYGGTAPCVDEKDGGDGFCDVCGAVMDPLAKDREAAIAKLEAIVNGNDNKEVQKMLASYVDQINNASSLNEINRIVSNATSALKNQIEIANEGSLVSAIRALVNLCDHNHQKTTNKVMGIIKPILGIFGIR